MDTKALYPSMQPEKKPERPADHPADQLYYSNSPELQEQKKDSMNKKSKE